jgi:hypothetical protein
MFPDLFLPFSFNEYFRLLIAGLVIILMGNSLVYALKIDAKGRLEKLVFSLSLVYCAFHLLALGVFFTKSDWPVYIFFFVCFINLFFVYKIKFKDTLKINPLLHLKPLSANLKTIYPWIYGSTILTILYYLNYISRSSYLEVNEFGKIMVMEDWDNMQVMGFVNVAKDFFFPTENPNLPGEPPMYFSWLGNLMPILFIKYFNIDLIHSYTTWGPLFFQLACIVQIHYLVNQYTQNKWLPLFAINLVFLNPFFSYEIIPLRSLAGIFLVLSTFLFIGKYLSTKKRIYLVLSFSWSFLYLSKGNYILPFIPAMAYFYLHTLYDLKTKIINYKNLIIISAVFIFPCFLFWFSRQYFGTTVFFPFFSTGWAAKFKSLSVSLLPIAPYLIVYIYFYYKFSKTLKPFSILQKTLLIFAVGIIFIKIFVYYRVASDSLLLLILAASIHFPVIIQKFNVKSSFLYPLIGTTMVLFILIKPFYIQKEPAYETTKDELKMISFLRHKTPKNSVFISNVKRYNDRPTYLSYLSYRKQFIEEGERFTHIYKNVLEDRIYDYFNFLTCECSKEDQRSFLNKYKFLTHLIIYTDNFIKKGNVIIGMEEKLIYGSPTFQPNSEVFQLIYKNLSAKVYQVIKPKVLSN